MNSQTLPKESLVNWLLAPLRRLVAGHTEADKWVKSQQPDTLDRSYSKLMRRFIVVSVAFSVVPLLLVGWGSYLYYSRFSVSRMSNHLQKTVEYNRKIVQDFLR